MFVLDRGRKAYPFKWDAPGRGWKGVGGGGEVTEDWQMLRIE